MVPVVLGVLSIEGELEPVFAIGIVRHEAKTCSKVNIVQKFAGVCTSKQVVVVASVAPQPVVVVQFNIVGRLDLSVQGAMVGQIEPQFHLVGQVQARLVLGHSLLYLYHRARSLSINLDCHVLLMAEVVTKNGVG